MADVEKVELGAAERVAEKRAPESDGGAEGDAPKLFAWIASLAMILLLMAGLFLERGKSAPLRVAGVVLFALAAGFIFAPFLLLFKYGEVEQGGMYMQTEAVVKRGLCGIVRHPQYLGYMLLAGDLP
jgi:protein-S-isoprenylcysteine O-methyltransferase Ste14